LRNRRRALAFPFFLAFAACAPRPAVRVEGELPTRVAVLPFDNQTVNMVGPDQLRRLIFEGVVSRGFIAQPIAETDELLRGLGVTDGGQLKVYMPSDLAKKLGVEGLFYGVLEQFTVQNVGFALRRVVVVRLELVGAGGGRLWEGSGKGSSGRLALKKGEAKKLFADGLSEQAAENALRVPLMRESRSAVENLLQGLPRRYY
jgi:hypothetical protein